ncbi:MAG: DUF1697 domain-containing protein [Proteobacteria bacterium]|nr:DUF1697 domain-containing protein [Pseudomonadota bacterium]
MPRYIAFLRGVSPQNARSADLKQAFEHAGYANVRTVLASGNVVFDARSAAESALERRAEAAMQEVLGCSFYTIVRAARSLNDLIAADPFAQHAVPSGAKRVVSFLRAPVEPKLALPFEADGARLFGLFGREAYTCYLPSEKGPVFMQFIERAFGANVTTRTWETVVKCARA